MVGPTEINPEGAERDDSPLATIKRSGTEFIEDGMTDWAAALTYYGLLSLFPMLIALVSIIGLFADPATTTEKLTEIVSNLGPDTAADTFKGPVEGLTSNRGASGVTFVIGLVLAIWAASGYIGAFSRASNVIFETREGRPFWKLKPLQLGVTLAMVLILALLAIGLVMTGPVVRAVAEPLGIGSTAVDVWNYAKWPVMIVLVLTLFAVLFHFSPNVRTGRFRFFTPGAGVALLVWILASAGFAFYVGNFGSYNETYGTLGGFVVLLIWFWISNLAVLFGLELNSEFERSRQISAGVGGAERQLQLDPRAEPKPKKTA
ncbi:MAG TPA: YihY/virulence factor BrkB family protein [Solirubrobacterales bacterium]|jgi:membrane protein|nr:YihY/virulence factor BrkB family protein [Solirubrobacterales bacterium]HMU27330.1 YihY/virulence factor BrkB family protein [Solirubrobacterales bacterium]HMX71747.1 YihY/virulence factor BrkB family protein [Solirubrobacterales bacterium]HMY25268.1 YihY/virulence factor BrkB family protein [Solirubrobacterales bacterium]HNA24087.1 YihY/virulence factor BrkB family protein [Solirubrobacterales bacterium]